MWGFCSPATFHPRRAICLMRALNRISAVYDLLP
ncbi:hypothetical protein V2J09_011824 [Rumex salicifolius]